MKKKNGILWGLAFVAVGAIWALKSLGILDFNIFFDGWWTLFIIVPCAIGLFTDHDKGGNLIGLLIGGILLLWCQDVVNLSLFRKLLIPGIIVLIGLKILLSSLLGNGGDQVMKRLKSGDTPVKSWAATFSGTTVDFTGEVFSCAQLDAVFGSIKCDLRGAVINDDCVINATAVFGGIDIFVPAGVNVKISSNSLFGGVSGKDRRNDPNCPYTLYINGTCLFGGVEIK